jgi:uncharacterized protein (DUF433 family)
MKLKASQALEFVQDLKSGLTDHDLRNKYGLSERKFYAYKAIALDIIAKENAGRATQGRRISARQVLSDLRSGVDDERLMSKYDLVPRQLQSVFRQLISAGLITPMELSKRLSITKSQVMEAFVEMGKAIRELD